jgi:7-cyano-7-deazaguanine synthase
VVRKSPAVVLLSGGLDSATTLALAAREGFAPYALSLRYGQRHLIELAAAERVARAGGAVRHLILDVDLGAFGGSALTSDEIAVPHHDDLAELEGGIPVTYVPARNTVFLSLALAWSETLSCSDIFLGVNALDYSGYPDCRPEYIAAFRRMAELATKAGVEGGALQIHTPLIELSKADIIRVGTSLGVDYALTHSCYEPGPSGAACRTCDSCLLRAKGFAEAGLADPALAATPPGGGD